MAAIQLIKTDIQNSRKLHLPDLSRKFIIYTDASRRGIGAALVQESSDENLEIVQWGARRFVPRELNYTITEKECLSVIWALELSDLSIFYINR